jgi:hypothetical protein
MQPCDDAEPHVAAASRIHACNIISNRLRVLPPRFALSDSARLDDGKAKLRPTHAS